jgi:Outer membrane protein beta-barrel domain
MKSKNRFRQIIAAAAASLILSASGYAQNLEKGKVEATGQVGLVTGIRTHASFAGSVGKALTDRVFMLGELGYIPLGGASASGSGPGGGLNFDAGGKVVTFMGGAQYQFSEKNAFIPYAGVGLGLVHSSFSSSSTVNGQTTNLDVSSNNFYVNFGGGARYYMKDRWGIKPELMIFAGDDSFFRFSVGVFYQFGR